MAKRKKDSNKLLVFFILFILFLFVLSLIVYGSKLVFKKFLVTNVDIVEVRPDAALIRQADLEFLKNKNIFEINLREAADYLSAKYPQFSGIKIYKHFPNKIIVELNLRHYFAQIKSQAHFYIVDKDFVIVRKEADLVSNLVKVMGVRPKNAGSKIAIKKTKQEKLAKYLIDFFNTNKQYPRISSVDVSSLPDIKLILVSGAKIIISMHEFNEKIKLLLYLLPKIKQDIGKIDYIDLRFKEPIINYKKN